LIAMLQIRIEILRHTGHFYAIPIVRKPWSAGVIKAAGVPTCLQKKRWHFPWKVLPVKDFTKSERAGPFPAEPLVFKWLGD